ncbi:penicillin-binding protein [Candidatus Nomurabacteria bacterium]|nr:penicillin-binding protein [Candidatus Nomurabacteria bacterium]
MIPLLNQAIRKKSKPMKPRKIKTQDPNKAIRKSYRRNLRKRVRHSSVKESVGKTIYVVFRQFFKAALVVILITALLLGGIGSGMMVGYITTAQPLNVLQLQNANETSFIYDSAGNEIAKLTGSQNIDREYISYDRFEETYINEAFIAIEDERFETHIGIDYRRIAGALISFAKTLGNPTSGGSTITQQVVKMISGDDQRSAQRKIQEWYNAVRLERQLKKWEIIELYANLIPMGNSYIGLQSASKGYFGKDASELNLAECAFLAGIPNLPGIYNPLTESGRRNAFRRQRIVLGKMLELGRISQDEYNEALETEIRFVTKTISDVSLVVNSYFVDYTINKVKNDLMKERGYSSSLALTTIYNYGVKIHTTQDPVVQSAVDKAFNNEKLFVTDPKLVVDFPEHAQAGMVIIDPTSVQIKAMAGGFGKKEANFVLNRATGIERQPGSTIKPIAVYAPAMDMGLITGSTIIEDKQLFLNKQTPNDPYPKNSYTGFLGNMTVRNALKISSNIVAAQIWMLLGGQNSLDYLKKVGIDRPSENYVSIALGGFNQGMSPLLMASAYTVFPNNGQYSAPICYTSVTDVSGSELLVSAPKFYQVYRPETAAIMNDMLQEPMTPSNTAFGRNGTANGYQINNEKKELITTCGKTGTADGNRDKWFVGYTPYYVGAVWYGYDGRLKTINIPKSDQMNSVRIWHDVMTKIHAKLEPKDFYMPPTVVEAEICISSGKLATDECRAKGNHVVTEYYMENSLLIPTELCDIHLLPTPTPEPSVAPTPTSAPTVEPSVLPTAPPLSSPGSSSEVQEEG